LIGVRVDVGGWVMSEDTNLASEFVLKLGVVIRWAGVGSALVDEGAEAQGAAAVARSRYGFAGVLRLKMGDCLWCSIRSLRRLPSGVLGVGMYLPDRVEGGPPPHTFGGKVFGCCSCGNVSL
jgi:hypothetical protein